MNMIITLNRYGHSNESTLGLMLIDSVFECYTLEDEHREEKLAGETRIPAGIYEIKFREEITRLTQRYMRKFSWFRYHLELQDVPGFTHVYIHIGNDDDDTNACILTGDTANNNQLESGFIGKSTQAFERVYRKITKQLEIGKRVFIHIKD